MKKFKEKLNMIYILNDNEKEKTFTAKKKFKS
jgi:hypothetical protein